MKKILTNFLKCIATSSVVLMSLSSCNRAAIRVPYASFDFQAAKTSFSAKKNISGSIRISFPTDSRKLHISEKVAGTNWSGCTTDASPTDGISQLLYNNINREISDSRIFINDGNVNAPKDEYVLEADVHTFCSKAVGFIFVRVAGIVSVDFKLTKNGHLIYNKKIEHVVTDADKEYTGSQATFIEQAMRVTEIDSLRLVLKDLMIDLENTQNESGSHN